MAERFSNRMSRWRGRGIPVDHANRDNWQQDYIIPLCSISAKTRLSPPITYWEASQDTDALKGSIDSRQNSVWRNIKFTLNLRTTNVNHYRFLNLHCEPLPPLGYPPDRMSLSLSLEPDREEVMLFRYGKTHAGNSVDLRLFSYGSCRQYTKNSPGSSYRWTAILNNLRDALHQADGIMDLKLILEKEDDMEMLRSFLAAAASYRLDEAMDTNRTRVPTEPRAARLRRESRTQFLELVGQRPVVIEHRPPCPQTNPNPNPRVYDPFPGIPVPLVRGERTWANDGLRPTNDTKVSSESPAGTSHMLAAMALSDGGVGEGGANEGASLESHEDPVSAEGSSEEWSFLRKKPGDPGQVNSSSSSSSSPSSPLPGAIPIVSRSWERGPVVVQSSSSTRLSSSPVPTPAPSPTVRRRRGPVVVKSESESSDVEIVSSRKLTKVRSKKKKRGRKSAQLGSGEEEKEQETKKKKKKKRKKRTEFPEPTDEEEAPVHNGECDDDEEMGGEAEEEEPINSDIERRRRKKERKRARKAKELNNDKYVDNDGDVDMQNYENGSSKRWKKKKPKAAESELDSTSPAAEPLPKRSKKRQKGKSARKPPQSESEELPPLPPLSVKSSSKRKRHDYSTSEVEENDSMGEESSGDISAWKKRLLEINLAKNELYVEERELRAKILREQLTARKQKAGDGHRFANCTCSACGEYGHRKDSWVCEKHPGRIGR